MSHPIDANARRHPPLRLPLLWTVLACGAAAAVAVLGTRLPAGAEAVEARFLTLLSTATMLLLAPAALRWRRNATAIVPWSAALLLATLAILGLGAGPARGTAVTTVLVVAIAGAWLGELPGPRDLRLDLTVLAPVAVAIQLVTRAELLVTGGSVLHWLPRLLAMPLLGAAIMAALARLFGGRRTMLAAAAVLAVTGSWSVAALATLAVLALLPPLLARAQPLWLRGLAAAPMVALLAWRPTLAVATVLTMLALWPRRLWLAAALVAGGVLTGAVSEPTPWREVARWWPVLFVVAPFLPSFGVSSRPSPDRSTDSVVDPGGDRASAWAVIGAGFAALVALRVLPPTSALAAPAGLLGWVAAGPRAAGDHRPIAARHFWLVGLWATGALLAAYPWLGPAGISGLLESAGWRSVPQRLLLASTLVALTAAGTHLAVRRARRFMAAIPALGLLCLLTPAAARLAAARTLLEWPPRVLSRAAPRLELPVGIGPLPIVVVDSSLANAGDLPAGTEAASMRLIDDSGRTLATAALCVGRDTGEWAAGSPDLATAPAPPPYLSVVAEGASFFAHRYRSAIPLRPPPTGSGRGLRLAIERAPTLPDPVELTVYGVQLRAGTPGSRSDAGAPVQSAAGADSPLRGCR